MSEWGQRSGSHLRLEVCGNNLSGFLFVFYNFTIEIERERENTMLPKREMWNEKRNSFGINKIAYDLFIIMCNYVDAYKLMTLQLGGDNNNNDADYRKTQFYEATATTTTTTTWQTLIKCCSKRAKSAITMGWEIVVNDSRSNTLRRSMNSFFFIL